MLWFKKKEKKEWKIREAPPCGNTDCVSWTPWSVTLNNYSIYDGHIPPKVVTCLLCTHFERTDCYVKDETTL